ncbi:DNA-binding protein, partial [Bacteroides sp. 224]|uniref:HU family DNA-binding protein n=1 Tax=Bacteroides sp. 224 TaxID=2302936 RepID=UPI0013D270DF
ILSVLSNFVEAMLSSLYNGHSVNIQNFGVFSLSASTVGAAEEKDCTAKNIKAVRINFRPSTSVRPNLTSTRAGDRLEFVDLQTYLKSLKMSLSDEGDDSNNDGGNDGGNDSGGNGGDDFIDPSA